MPTILVATDFTAIGTNAAHYAASVAQSWGCDLLMLHTYFMPVTFNDPAMPIIPITDLRDAITSRMDKAETEMKQSFPGLGISTRTEYGDIQDTLAEVIEDVKPSLLIIGTHGEEGDESFWAGNTSADLLRNTQTPILAVPGTYIYRPIAQVCIAVDSAGLKEDASLTALQSFLKSNNAALHIVHAATAADSGEPIAIPSLGNEQKVILHPEQATGNVDDAIAEYVAANAIDCLVVIPHHYSFWESLFHKSHTKALLHKIHVPVLALH